MVDAVESANVTRPWGLMGFDGPIVDHHFHGKVGDPNAASRVSSLDLEEVLEAWLLLP